MSWSDIKYFFTKEWWIYHSPIYINLSFCKLYEDYRKVKNKIKGKPRLVFYKGDCGNDIWCDYYMDIHATYRDFLNKWFAIHTEPVGWKSRYTGDIEFQYCPEIVIVIFKKIRWTIRLEAPIGEENEMWWYVVIWLQSQKKD